MKKIVYLFLDMMPLFQSSRKHQLAFSAKPTTVGLFLLFSCLLSSTSTSSTSTNTTWLSQNLSIANDTEHGTTFTSVQVQPSVLAPANSTSESSVNSTLIPVTGFAQNISSKSVSNANQIVDNLKPTYASTEKLNNQATSISTSTAKPTVKSNVAISNSLFQQKIPKPVGKQGTTDEVPLIDDFSYRDIVEDWASAMMMLNHSTSSASTTTDFKQLNGTGTSRLSGDRISNSSGKKRRSVCRISEFSCTRGNKCISSDKYCDTIDDCGDRSDEPVSCTPCNRTYYGEWGSTYSLSLSSETIFGHGAAGASSMSSATSNTGPASSSGGGSRGRGMPNQFVCQLTFAAAGDNFGDLVQIMFDSINIGQFSSSMIDGCPSGSLQVAEISRPITGGHWCGSGSGLSVYYSEMSAIALTLSIGGGGNAQSGTGNYQHKLHAAATGETNLGISANDSSTHPQHVQIHQTNAKGDKTVITSVQQPIEFDFKIRYKFIPKSLAVVRYGLLNSPIERGELVPGTYCSRVLDSCHRKRCKIQSPNYPGLYPRNVSCYFTIRQRESPPSKKVLIQIIQLKPHKVQLRSIPGRLAGLVPASTIQDNTASLHDSFLAWEDCTGGRDGLIIYDGTTTDDPVLLKICGGSYIPAITSSGSGLLIAFHSTPFGNPLEPKPPAPYPTPLRGFELDVDVVVVDSKTADYSNHQNCTFYFTSKKVVDGEGGGLPDDVIHPYSKYQSQEHGGNWISGKVGSVKSPRHTLPQNTTCRYEFRGSKHENIWIYFVSYRRVLIKDSKEIDGNCTTRLRIMDGLDARNEVRLATYCDNELPKLCDHRTLENETRVVRACTANESFISAGSRLIVEQQFLEGTALRHLHYHFNYEFVSRHTGTDGSCNRRYHSSKMRSHGSFRTTDNVFDFGRGGRSNISCTYTIVLAAFESFHLTIRNSSFGERSCSTVVDLETGRYVCQYNSSSTRPSTAKSKYPKSEIRLYEYIWPSSNMTAHQHCICGNVSGQAFIFLGKKVEFVFTVENMKSDESYENFFVEFDYRVVKGGGCRADNHHELKKRTGGIITLESMFVRGLREKIPTCESYPWLLQGTDSHSLYLRIPGFTMIEDGRDISRKNDSSFSLIHLLLPERPCPTTKNRIFIYNGEDKLVQKICPSSYQIGTGSTGTSGRKLGQTVEIYSDDFHQYNSPLYSTTSKSTFMVEFVGRELGTYRIHWLEVMSARMKIALQTMERDERRMGEAAKVAAGVTTGNLSTLMDKKAILEDPLFKSMFENGETTNGVGTSNDVGNFVHLIGGSSTGETISPCPYYCPELNACINEKLWCDGETHCPISEADEKSCDSFWLTVRQLMSPAVYIPIAAAIVSALICCMLVLTCLGLKRLIIVKTSSFQQRHHRGGGGDGSGNRRRPSDVGNRRVPRDLLIDPHDPIS